MFSVLPLWKKGRRRRFFFFLFFFLNGRRTHFPKQPAGLFFQDGRQTYVTIFKQMEKLMRESKYKMRSFYITCDLFLRKKIKNFAKRSYFSCVFNSFFK